MSPEDDEDNENENESVDSDTIEVEAPPPRDEPLETRSLEARCKLRDQMQSDIEAFLRSGGRIEQVAPNVSAQDAATTPVQSS